VEAQSVSASESQPSLSGAPDKTNGEQTNRHDWLIGIAVAGLLTLIFGLVNWHWLQVNVVTYGWDRLDHLITTLVFNNMLAAPGPTTLYNMLAYASYYPPLVHYAAAAAYQLFGVSEEIAVMSNLLFFFVLLLATWFIARRLSGGPNGTMTGVLAMLILATFPMIFAMSRYLYLDFALTALAALCVALLLASDRLSRRRPALWFGVAIGASFFL
jgi:4-amino-4-deoxy-L-arabinose transferase-like glycosyltransferase